MSNKTKVPSYCHHKASGRAVVRIDGRDHYLGPYGSDQSHAEYARLIVEWRVIRQTATVKSRTVAVTTDPSSTVSEVLLKYRDFAREYYSRNGKPGKEYVEMRMALKPLRELYGHTLAREVGPLKLQAVRQQMIDSDLSRGVINNRINRVKRFFKWAVSEELIPSFVYEALRTVAGLARLPQK